MATVISLSDNPAGVSASSNVATYSGVSIGASAPNRTVVVGVISELASTPINSCTIDYGSGDVSMSAGTAGNFGAVYTRLFYLAVPGPAITATIKVTFGTNSPSSTQNKIQVFRVVGGVYSSSGGDGSSDMDATDPLTTGAITIPSGGGFIAVAGGATDTVAKTWANASEVYDADVGAFRATSATRVTALAATAVTCTGGTNGEDGALSWIIFDATTSPTVALNSPADTAEITDTTPTLDFTGTDTENDSIRYQVQISPKNFDAIALDTSGQISTSATSQVTQSITVASGNNRKLKVFVANNSSEATPSPPAAITYNGDALTKIADQDAATGANNVSFWELNAPDVGTANLVIDATATFDYIDVGYLVVQNASQSASLGDGMTIASTDTPYVYIPCPLPGSWAVSCVYGTSTGVSSLSLATELITGYPSGGYSTSADAGPILHIYEGGGLSAWAVAWSTILPAYADGLVQGISGNNYDYSDNFDDNSLAAMWTSYTANSGAVSETSQQLSLTCANTTNGSWAGIYSDSPIDLRGSSIEMEIVDGTGGNTYLDLTLCAETLPNTNRYFISIGVDTGLGNLQAYKKFGGTIDTIMAGEVFNATNHKYVRIREHAGIVYWEYSANSSTWTELWSEPAPVDMSSLYLVVDDYEYNNGASPGAHIVDNLIMEVWEASAFVNPDTGADTDPFNSGENIQYTVQTALSLGTYYWRVRGIDPSGSNTYGAWATTRSFDLIASGTTTRRYSLTTLSVG